MSVPYPQKKTLPQMPIARYEENNKLVTINANALIDVPAAINEWKCKRVMLVVSKSLNDKTDKIQKLENALGSAFVGKKVGVGAHSPYADVLAIAKLAHELDADSIVCIGSSSYSDATKIARLLHGTFPPEQLTEETMESLVDQELGGTKPNVFKRLSTRLILVPCSLSVSEYNPASSASNRSGKKQHFGSAEFIDGAADLILLDPDMASTAPAETLWLPSGARSVDHSVETLCCTLTQPKGHEHAVLGLKAMLNGLKEYKEGLSNTNDREKLLKGISDCQQGAREAFMGLTAYDSKFGPSHAMGHQLGSVGKVAHGHTSCVCLAPTLRYEKTHQSQYWDASAQKTILDIFESELGWKEEDAGDAIEKFFRSLGLPTRLSEVGVTEEEKINKVAEKTMSDYWMGGPQQVTDPKAILEILNNAR